ncbi:MAG TPA: outer membrane beta-barrel family protein [Chitinophagaceae bacterium]|nr:outer membrane beta-barrel family protein [Chitinophagaceae bacterium]
MKLCEPRFLSIYLVIIVSFLSVGKLYAQPSKGTVRGVVFDSISATGLAYSSVQVFDGKSRKLVNGNLTNEKGEFVIEVPLGKFFALIEFSGYKDYSSKEFTISAENLVIDLGVIQLASRTTVLEGVVVQGERSYTQLSLDKKIFNVGKDLANAGGSATDILTNIPSVSVDPEGNVKLRGSDNVRILIDGKPSGLVSFKGSGGLQGLPASLIDRVEIITNPSARYEAEGNAGIINIVLKKDKRQGFNGSVEVITGHPTNLGAATNFNYRHKKINFFLNYGIAYRNQPGIGSIYQEVYKPDSTLISIQNSEFILKGLNNNIRGGLDYYFTEKSILTASYLYRRSDATRTADIWYDDYLFNKNNLTSITNRKQDEEETEPNSEYTLSYKKTFEKKDHELSATARYIDNWESSNQYFTQYSFDRGGARDHSKDILQQSLNDEFEKHWLFQLDYVQPLGKEGKFETGFRSSFRDMINDFVVQERDASGVFVPLPGLDNIFHYDENIHAAYGILANRKEKLSYQAGLRTEWTDVTTLLEKGNILNPRKYFNLFPSAHLTLQLAKENAIQLSYSRRVRRPFYNDLSPFMTYSDSRNFFSGNPDLDPEFSDVGEIGHIKEFEKGTVSSSLYYRKTTGKIERIRQVNEDGNSVTLPQNLLSEKAWGAEFTSTWKPYLWWKLDLNANFFHADIDGSNIFSKYKASTYSWFARQTSRFSLPGALELQLRSNYEAPQRTAQGRRKALYFLDLSASKDVLQGKGTITLNTMDVFNTRKIRSISTGSNFYTEGLSQFRRRQVNLTFSYRIRQSKPTPKREAEE